jgi:hypothetical protein
MPEYIALDLELFLSFKMVPHISLCVYSLWSYYAFHISTFGILWAKPDRKMTPFWSKIGSNASHKSE